MGLHIETVPMRLRDSAALLAGGTRSCARKTRKEEITKVLVNGIGILSDASLHTAVVTEEPTKQTCHTENHSDKHRENVIDKGARLVQLRCPPFAHNTWATAPEAQEAVETIQRIARLSAARFAVIVETVPARTSGVVVTGPVDETGGSHWVRTKKTKVTKEIAPKNIVLVLISR